MKSKELPDGWIVETSKSHPDRVYYFNTKTKQSSWELPTDVYQNAGPSKPATKGRKRKNEDLESESRPVTPDFEIPKRTKARERSMLKAKRTSVSSEKKNEAKQNAVESKTTDTPQMILLRQKMLERQAQSAAFRKLKVTRAETPRKEVPDVSVPEASSSQDKAAAVSTEEVASSDLAQEAQNLTPQMRVLIEKMNNRKSKGGNLKTLGRRSMALEVKQTPLRRPRTRSIGPAGITSEPKVRPRRSSRSNAAEEGNGRTVGSIVSSIREKDREITEALNESPPAKRKQPRLGRSARKNVAEERLENFRRSLTEGQAEEPTEVDGCETTLNVSKISRTRKTLCPGDSMESTKIEITPPRLYKNADVRAKFIQERLHNESLREKKINSPTVETSRRYVDEERTTIAPADSFYEEMEWEPIEDEKITEEVQAVRSYIGAFEVPPRSQEIPENSLDLPDGPSAEQRKPSLYIVVDTNVFLSNLQGVEEARDAIFSNYGRPLIVVPWTVLRELDFIKDDKSMSRPECLRAKARQAVRFLHQHFSARHPRVLGQTPFDVSNNRQRFESECPDDEILQTCLQIRSSENNVVLLSYDKNLCNKAMIHDVVTLGRHDPLEKVDFLHASDAQNESFLTLSLRGEGPGDDVPIYVKELRHAEELMEEAKDIVKTFMSVIVAREMQNLYGNNWERHTYIKPPWSVRTVLSCALKHWMAAISDSFARRANNLVKELSEAINKVPDSGRKLSDVSRILELINDILQCVKMEKYPTVIAESSRKIAASRVKCLEITKKLQEEKLQDTWERKEEIREEEARAARAFQQFEEVYEFARDTCGLAATAIGMPCSFPFKKLNPEPTVEELKEMQPEVAANLNRLLQVLGTALEETDALHVDHRAVEALYQALSTFTPDRNGKVPRAFIPLDVYWCLKKKDKVLKLGLSQLQELSSHFCRMASFRCT